MINNELIVSSLMSYVLCLISYVLCLMSHFLRLGAVILFGYFVEKPRRNFGYACVFRLVQQKITLALWINLLFPHYLALGT